jgi:light-regulated signal transduction histidine kinase (bacteriophytochrome)
VTDRAVHALASGLNVLLSTRDEVTKLSGRGVGLSALRAICQEMGGSVELQSTLGQGTTLRCVVRVPELQRAHASRRLYVRSLGAVQRA